MIKTSYDAKSYWEKRLTEKFDLQGVGYLSYPPSYNTWLYRAKERCLKLALQQINKMPFERIVCDIGCGTGYFTKWYKDYGVKSYYGLDISPTSIKQLGKTYPSFHFHTWTLGQHKPAPVPKSDIVHCFDVIYHVTDDDMFGRSLTQIRTMLKPGGLALITDLYGEADMSSSDHVKQRSITTWKNALTKAKLKLISAIPMYTFLNRPVGYEPPIARKILFRLARYPAVLYYLDGLFLKLGLIRPSMHLLVVKKT